MLKSNHTPTRQQKTHSKRKRTKLSPHRHSPQPTAVPARTVTTIITRSAPGWLGDITPPALGSRRRGFAGFKPPPGKKLSQAELIIQQHREKQKAAELEKIRAAQAAQAAGTQAPPIPKGQRAPPKTAPPSSPPKTTQQQQQQQHPGKPTQEPGKDFLREQKMGKTHKLPPGMTIEELNKMSPEMIAKTLNIDMGMIEALNDDREDEFDVQFSEDSSADATPPLPYRPDPGEDGVKYTAARIQGRHTVNMMPSVAPRPANFKGRLTIIRKLPPHFEQVHRSLRKVVMTLMKIQKLSHFDLAVTLVAAQGMQFINRQHRFVDSPTDVLAFTMEEPYCEGIPVELGNIADLGEIIISVPYVYAQSAVRHAMLRSLGHDLSDSKRPLTDIERVKKIFQDVGQVEIAGDGSLKVHQLTNRVGGAKNDNIVDIDSPTNDTTKFGNAAEKLAGALPPITLTSAQLDTLPPFDKEYIHAQVQEMMTSDQRQEQHFASMNRKAQKAMEALDSMRDSNPHLINSSGGSGGDSNRSKTLANNIKNNNTRSTHNGHDLVNHDSSSPPPPTWHLSQGFPPQDYFRYITESMVIDEMNIVLIHGFLHLCGYDHETGHRRDLMQAETDRVVSLLLKEGAISQRCADLSSLYVLDDAPEFVSEESEDELLPAGLFVDQDVKPMSDGEIAKKLREFEDTKGLSNNVGGLQGSKLDQKKKSTAPFTSTTTTTNPVDANYASSNKNNNTHHQQQQHQHSQFNQTVSTSGPTSGQFRVHEDKEASVKTAAQFHNTNKPTPMTATSARDIFKQKKPSGAAGFGKM